MLLKVLSQKNLAIEIILNYVDWIFANYKEKEYLK